MTGADPRYPEPDDDVGDDDGDDAEALFADEPPDDLAPPALRLAGRLLDVVVDFVATSLVGAVVERVVYSGGAAPLAVAVVVVIGVPTLVEATAVRTWGRTAGMAVLGMRVVGRDDGPVGWRDALVRAGSLMVLQPLFPIVAPFLVGVPVVFDRWRRGVHDRLAGTLVVRSGARR